MYNFEYQEIKENKLVLSVTETEELDSDANNLTSLHEVLLDEREMTSDDDKNYVCDSNTYAELIPAYEKVSAEMTNNINQTTEKGINELCKVSTRSYILMTILRKS